MVIGKSVADHGNWPYVQFARKRSVAFLRRNVLAAALSCIVASTTFGLGYMSAYFEHVDTLATSLFKRADNDIQLSRWAGAESWNFSAGALDWEAQQQSHAFRQQAQPHAAMNEVTLVVVSDKSFIERYALQTRTVECYAARHGYKFALLDPAEEAPLCESHHSDFFFRKHCTVRHFLNRQPYRSTIVVFDADVVAGVSNMSLARWIDAQDFDLAFYERSWNFEIAAGNYIVRNTKFAHDFLQLWANYEYLKPTGFHSSDNGAIHLAVLEALAVRRRHLCYDMYRNLTDNVENLAPYFAFVSCTRKLLGPVGNHHVFSPTIAGVQRKVVAKITIFPRLFGFAVDPYLSGLEQSRALHPFHHGVKESDNVLKHYGPLGNVSGNGTCVSFSKALSRLEIVSLLKNAEKSFFSSTSGDPSCVPRWRHLNSSCIDDLWCPPITWNASTVALVDGVVAVNGTLQKHMYSDPGRDWHSILFKY
jgi:Protein of unknown function, DUF273